MGFIKIHQESIGFEPFILGFNLNFYIIFKFLEVRIGKYNTSVTCK